jgi:thiol-disulfide isomerase/thioredoxin
MQSKMNKLFYGLIFILVFNQTCICMPRCQQVILKVNIQDGLKGFLFISTNQTTQLKIDTFSLDQRSIAITDCINGPKQYACTVEAEGFPILAFALFIEADIPLELSLISNNDTLLHSFSGSKTQIEWNLYEKIVNEIMQNTGNRDSIKIFDKEFIKEYRDSYVSGVIIALNSSLWSADTISYYLNLLTPKARTFTYASIAEQIMNRKGINSAGSTMQSFTAFDWQGKALSSDQFSGKIVLLEFWASWCEPCRKSFPALQKFIKPYQKLGLEVVGISEDIKPEAWLKAIETDSLQNWYHVLSGLKEDIETKKPEKRISYRFGVTVFPTRMLVNENGIIIGRWEGDSEENTSEMKALIAKTIGLKGIEE